MHVNECIIMVMIFAVLGYYITFIQANSFEIVSKFMIPLRFFDKNKNGLIFCKLL